jgi:hypothetical protein
MRAGGRSTSGSQVGCPRCPTSLTGSISSKRERPTGHQAARRAAAATDRIDDFAACVVTDRSCRGPARVHTPGATVADLASSRCGRAALGRACNGQRRRSGHARKYVRIEGPSYRDEVLRDLVARTACGETSVNTDRQARQRGSGRTIRADGGAGDEWVGGARRDGRLVGVGRTGAFVRRVAATLTRTSPRRNGGYMDLQCHAYEPVVADARCPRPE